MARTRSTSELDPFFDELSGWADATAPVVATLSYGDDASQELDLRLPDGDGPHPVAVVLHGGFWRTPYLRNNTSAVAAALTRAGWASANVEYRRLGPGSYAAMLADVAAARLYLDGVDAPLDLSRTMAIGHSAGGHLRVVARVCWRSGQGRCPRGRLRPRGRRACRARSERGMQLLGGEPSAVPEAYEAADPARRLPLGVAQLLAHGTADGVRCRSNTRSVMRSARVRR